MRLGMVLSRGRGPGNEARNGPLLNFKTCSKCKSIPPQKKKKKTFLMYALFCTHTALVR